MADSVTSEGLVERVAQRLWDAEGVSLKFPECQDLARQIIPMIYEDAARVAEGMMRNRGGNSTPDDCLIDRLSEAIAQSIRSRVLDMVK